MKVEYIDHMGSDLSAVNAARVSMDKESAWEEVLKTEIEDGPHAQFYDYKLSDKDTKLIRYLAKHKHTSCFEHQAVTLRLKVPIFIARQIQRHRAFSYNEISRRYVKDNLEFYWPDKWRKAAENVKQGSSDEDFIGKDEDNPLTLVESATDWYNRMIEQGMCAEQARMLLPQNLYTTFYMTGNLRNWIHFLKLRLDSHAQKEVRDVAEMCEKIIAPLFPVAYKELMEA